MAVIIRHAGPGDEPVVVELIQELAVTFDYPTTIDEHYVRHFLARPSATCCWPSTTTRPSAC